MKVVLAEKPSVARDLAAFLGARAKRQGYYEGPDVQVTWAFGHLVSLKEPDEYDPSLKKWTLATLPFIPETFLLKEVGDTHARQQLKVIKTLFKNADHLICATDAGREGELIFRYILHHAKCESKPFERLWLSSLTDAAIKQAFGNLKPGSDYDNLYAAARSRSESDWIVGLNATRNFTVRFGRDNGVLWSVGRVQTPVLAMITRRDDEIRHFIPKAFWELTTTYRDTVFRYTGDRFDDQTKAQALADQIAAAPFTITDVKTKPEKTPPPLLYDLTTLQRDMNVRYGFSAADTLKTAQSLYESKAITYPRTDSQYLSRDMVGQVAAVVKRLHAQNSALFKNVNLDKLTTSARIYNDKKVTDHHAIIPTGKSPGNLPPASQKIFDAITLRLIAAHHPDCLKDVTTVLGQVGELKTATKFRARGVRMVDLGWTHLYPSKSKAVAKTKDDSDDQQTLPAFTKDETGPHTPNIKEGQTKPPRHFTENSLLGAMETAGRMVDDESLKEALKEKGLGTPATRASIIETLLNRRYITRQAKNLTATDLGRYLIAVIQDPNLKSPELTGEWEAKFKQIEQGTLDSKIFIQQIADYTNHLIHHSVTPKPLTELGPCPRCAKPIVEGRASFGCSGWKDGCTFVYPHQYQTLTLTKHQLRQLIQRRVLTQPLALPDEPRAVLALTDDGQVTHMTAPTRDMQKKNYTSKKTSSKSRTSKTTTSKSTSTSPTKKVGAKKAKKAPAPSVCPSCGSGIIDQQKSYSCSDWRNGCKFVIWKTIASKKISPAMAKRLLSKGSTLLLKGFKSKSGKSFNAKLIIKDGLVAFEFENSN